jgi:hypothetical protein
MGGLGVQAAGGRVWVGSGTCCVVCGYGNYVLCEFGVVGSSDGQLSPLYALLDVCWEKKTIQHNTKLYVER